MLTSIRYIFISALRDKLFIGLIAALLFAVLIAKYLGGAAMLEEQQMTLAYAAATSRFICILGLVTFICFHIFQARENHYLEVMLSRPISRTTIIFSYFTGFGCVALLLSAFISLVIALLEPMAWTGYFAWAISLLCESLIVTALAIFAAFILPSAVSAVLASLGLYFLARMMAFFLLTANSNMSKTLEWHALYTFILEAISYIVPRLDMYANSEWLIYGVEPEKWMWFLCQTAIFVPFLLLAASIDFKRKTF